jgi:hypothetical protein
MRRQASRAAVVWKAGAVAEVPRNPSSPMQVCISAHAEGVLLVMIEQEEIGGRSKERQSTGPFAPPLSTLA